jgi:hypothetical protein
VNAEELTAEDDWMAELLALSADKHVRNELDISVWREGEKDGYGLPNPRTRFQFLLWAHFDRLVAEVDSLRTQLAEAQAELAGRREPPGGDAPCMCGTEDNVHHSLCPLIILRDYQQLWRNDGLRIQEQRIRAEQAEARETALREALAGLVAATESERNPDRSAAYKKAVRALSGEGSNQND